MSTYRPYYEIQADPIGANDTSTVIQWHHYPDEPLIEYHPDDEFLLNSSRVFDRWIRLGKEAPHTVKWEIQFSGGAFSAVLDANGITIGRDEEGQGAPLAPDKQHTLAMTRIGKKLSFIVDDQPAREIEVAEDSRAPLRIAAQVQPVRLQHTRLWFGNGEKLAPPPAAKAGAAPKWEKVFAEDFSKPESLDKFLITDAGNVFKWDKDAKALEMGPGNDENTLVLLHKPLPGDVRVTFRARSMLKGQPAFFGLYLGLKGKLGKGDGYFIEWNYWQVQIKKRGTRVAGEEVAYVIKEANQWMKFSAEKVGAVITMYTDGKKALTFTDDNPLSGADHDLLSFYSWKVPMQFTDLVIERNVNDTTVPRADDPAVPANYLNGERDGAKPPPPIYQGDF